jgi:hypothetical protein
MEKPIYSPVATQQIKMVPASNTAGKTGYLVGKWKGPAPVGYSAAIFKVN